MDDIPPIVEKCIESQKKYSERAGIKHVVITEQNVNNYIQIPDYIYDKVRQKKISLTHLSDIIRHMLLYKYGGFWMDATLWVIRDLGEVINYSLYMRKPVVKRTYCAYASWRTWFMYARQGGHPLFHFMQAAFFEYFKNYDTVADYYMMDFLIAIACNEFPYIERAIQEIPFNNNEALNLFWHLSDMYRNGDIERYTNNSIVQKLTRKHGPIIPGSLLEKILTM